MPVRYDDDVPDLVDTFERAARVYSEGHPNSVVGEILEVMGCIARKLQYEEKVVRVKTVLQGEDYED